MEELLINVNGMMCKNCVKHVEEALLKEKNVKKAQASLENKNVLVKGENLDKEVLISKIEAAGYEAF